MPDHQDLPLKPALTRETLLTLVLASLDSESGPQKFQSGAFFPPSVNRLLKVRIESVCRRIMTTHAPPSAPPFTSPSPGTDPAIHTAHENDRAFAAFEARLEFKWALCEIMDSEAIFKLAPPDAQADLLELRQLLREIPLDGI